MSAGAAEAMNGRRIQRRGRVYGRTWGGVTDTWTLTPNGWIDSRNRETFRSAVWGEGFEYELGLIPETIEEADIAIARARAEIAEVERRIRDCIGGVGRRDMLARAENALRSAKAHRAFLASEREFEPMAAE